MARCIRIVMVISMNMISTQHTEYAEIQLGKMSFLYIFTQAFSNCTLITLYKMYEMYKINLVNLYYIKHFIHTLPSRSERPPPPPPPLNEGYNIYRHLVIVDEDNKAVGMVTRKDLAKYRKWRKQGSSGVQQLGFVGQVAHQFEEDCCHHT